jgi:hypothetical protein
MAIEPEIFQVGESKLRWTPLAALVLAREHGKFIQRADQGALDMLAFQLTQSDQASLLMGDRKSPGALFVLLKTFASILGTDNLDEVCLHYLEIGKVEVSVEVESGNKTLWLPLWGERAVENQEMLADPADMYGGVWRVLRGLFDPFKKLLPASKGEEKEQDSGNDSSPPNETISPEAQTLESPSYS